MDIINVAALPLPAGAATEVTLLLIDTSLNEIEDAIENLEEALASIHTDYLLIGDAGSIINLDAAGDVQVDVKSGTIDTVTTITNAVAVTGTFWQATQPVSLATIPAYNAESDDDSLPAGQTRETPNALLYIFDGTNWERARSDGSGALKVVPV